MRENATNLGFPRVVPEQEEHHQLESLLGSIETVWWCLPLISPYLAAWSFPPFPSVPPFCLWQLSPNRVYTTLTVTRLQRAMMECLTATQTMLDALVWEGKCAHVNGSVGSQDRSEAH